MVEIVTGSFIVQENSYNIKKKSFKSFQKVKNKLSHEVWMQIWIFPEVGSKEKRKKAFAHSKKEKWPLLIGKLQFPSFWSKTITLPTINIPKLILSCYEHWKKKSWQTAINAVVTHSSASCPLRCLKHM